MKGAGAGVETNTWQKSTLWVGSRVVIRDTDGRFASGVS